jgi:hypothetical protein
MLPPLPELNRNETNREELYSNTNYQRSSEEQVSNRQELAMMVKKYDHYMKADSIEFNNRDISNANGSNFINEFKFVPDSREPQRGGHQNNRVNFHQREPSNDHYTRYYHSASRGRNN